MEEDRRKRIIVGIVIGLTVVAVFAILLLWKNSTCELVELEPIVGDSNNLENIANLVDYKSLANFDGYLTYLPGATEVGAKKIYLPLKLKSIGHTLHNSSQANFMSLNTNCANIELKLIDHTVTSIEIDLIIPTTTNGEDRCTIHEPRIKYSVGMHYNCSIQITYRCLTNSGQPMLLIVNKLEFEFGGNEELIEQGKFSTPGETCEVM